MIPIHNIYIASDHRGIDLKKKLIESLQKKKVNPVDLGADVDTSVDYPDYAQKLCSKIEEGDFGILICGTGIGMSIAANRYHHIRAALCLTPEMAQLARQHNNANILVLGSSIIDYNTAIECLESFFSTEFEGGRHAKRINKINCGDF